MSGKKKTELEFRYYDIPRGEQVLALLGREWVREYGVDSKRLHFHNLLEIGYCIGGEGEMVFDDKVVPYAKGTLTVIPKNFPHTTNSKLHTKSYWEYLFLNPEDIIKSTFPDNSFFAQKILETINRKEQCYAEDERKELVALVRLIMEECREKKSFSNECIRGMLTALLTMLARTDIANGNKLEKIKNRTGVQQIAAAFDYIEQKYMEEIRMKDLAAKCSLSETHFRRLFTEYMHMTPVEYLNLIRIQQACELMRKTGCSMEEVAHRSGYTAVSTFNRNFKRIIGTSPYQYKKSSENYAAKLKKAKVLTRKGW